MKFGKVDRGPFWNMLRQYPFWKFDEAVEISLHVADDMGDIL
jgi:hypothetical protein